MERNDKAYNDNVFVWFYHDSKLVIAINDDILVLHTVLGIIEDEAKMNMLMSSNSLFLDIQCTYNIFCVSSP